MLITNAKFKSVLLGALTVAYATGAVVLGVGVINASSIPNLALNLTGLSILVGPGFIIVKEGIVPKIKFIKNAKKDIEVSAEMIRRMTKAK